MTVVHVHGNHVAALTEGISRNVGSLVRALAAAGVPARLAAHPTPLEAMNRRRALALGALRARRMAQAALAQPGVEVVHCHVALPSLAALAPRGRGRRAVVVHAWNALREPGGPPVRGRLLHRLANGREAAALGLAGARDVVVSSRFQAAQLSRLPIRARVHVVPNGVDAAAFAPAPPEARAAARRALGVAGGGDGPVVLYYGHLSPWKGVDVLLDALPPLLASARGAAALLSATSYGGDPGRLAAQVARRGLAGRVRVRGPAPVPLLHAAADVAVVPARAAVGTACHPNVLLESMAAGLAVVASAVGSVPEVVAHGRNGLLVPPGDPAALAAALRTLAADPALARRLGHAARRTMQERFAWAGAARALRGVYRAARGDGAAEDVSAPVEVPA